MNIERVFEVTLNVSNPINFCINKKQNIFTELNNLYVDTCFMGSFILEIIDILQSSSCRIVNTNASATATIDVKFLARVFILSSWDILVGVKIEKNQSLIVGEYKKNNLIVDVSLKPTNIQSNSLNVGQLVPVRIIKAKHKPRENRIAAAAVLLTCDRKAVVYKVRGQIQKSSLPEIEILLNSIEEELNYRKDIKINIILFFESLLFSYKVMPKDTETIQFRSSVWTGPKCEGNKINILDTLNMDLTGYWIRPLNICRSSPILIRLQDRPTDYVLTAPHLMIIDIAKNILTFLIAIRELTEVYPDELNNSSSNSNIWNIMRQSQY
jgi:DNA-binding protein